VIITTAIEYRSHRRKLKQECIKIQEQTMIDVSDSDSSEKLLSYGRVMHGTFDSMNLQM
jgi:hypothetical protein